MAPSVCGSSSSRLPRGAKSGTARMLRAGTPIFSAMNRSWRASCAGSFTSSGALCSATQPTMPSPAGSFTRCSESAPPPCAVRKRSSPELVSRNRIDPASTPTSWIARDNRRDKQPVEIERRRRLALDLEQQLSSAMRWRSCSCVDEQRHVLAEHVR